MTLIEPRSEPTVKVPIRDAILKFLLMDVQAEDLFAMDYETEKAWMIDSLKLQHKSIYTSDLKMRCVLQLMDISQFIMEHSNLDLLHRIIGGYTGLCISDRVCQERLEWIASAHQPRDGLPTQVFIVGETRDGMNRMEHRIRKLFTGPVNVICYLQDDKSIADRVEGTMERYIKLFLY